MKKIIPLLLITLIFLNTFGFNLFLDYLLFQCKRDFSKESFYNSKRIVVLKITPEEQKNLQRVDDDEIRYKNKMYDIFKEIKKEDGLYIYCINDKTEDRLFEILFKINKTDVPDDQSQPLSTKNNLIKNYILNDKDILNFPPEKEIIFTQLAIFYNSPIKEIVLLPPELHS